MKTFTIIISIYLLSITSSFSQLGMTQNDGFCASGNERKRALEKLPWYGNNAYLLDILDSTGYRVTKFDYENVLYRVPLKLWIYRKSDGTEGMTEPEIKEMVSNLNYYNLLNNTGFLYYIRPDISYIDKNKRMKIGYWIESPITTTFHRKKNCVNLHIANDIIIKRMFRSNKAIRGSYNKVNHGVTLRRKATPTTAAHEIGHFFGLQHPHKNSDKGKCRQESVSRERKLKGCFKHGLNCEKNGDALCDTPAEPILNNSVDLNCNYVGDFIDNWGDTYVPQTNNIMSYPQTLRCREIFTPQQVAVMLYTAQKYDICAWTAKCKGTNDYKFQYYFDKFEPDDTQLMASEIFADSVQHHTFHKMFVGKKDVDNNTDWVFFYADSNVSTAVVSTSSGKYRAADTELFLYDQRGNLLAHNDNTAKNKYSQIEFKITKQGKYFVKIVMKNTVEAPDIADYKIKVELIKKQ